MNATLGPDAQRITEAQFLAAMKGRTGAIKSWLMNQNLWRGWETFTPMKRCLKPRIHPLAQPGRISAVKAHALFGHPQSSRSCGVSCAARVSAITMDVEGRPGAFLSKLKVYQHTGEPCRRCKQPIRRLVIGGRSSHFCPKCQPRPRYAFVRNAKKRRRFESPDSKCGAENFSHEKCKTAASRRRSSRHNMRGAVQANTRYCGRLEICTICGIPGGIICILPLDPRNLPDYHRQ